MLRPQLQCLSLAVIGGAVGLGPAVVWAEPRPSTRAAAEASDALSWSDVVRELVVNLIPEKFDNDKHWGQTEKVISGVRVRSKGGQVRVERREKRVNHGFWRRVKVRLLNPDRTLRLEFRNVRAAEDGGARFDLFLQARARCETQFAFWTSGVKGLNGAVESDLTLQAIVDCSFRLETVPKAGEFLPQVFVRPQIHDLDLTLKDVDTRRIGPLGGWAADELGNFTRKTVEDVLQSQEQRLLERLQKMIRKKEDRLRIDLNDWRKLVGDSPKSVNPPADVPVNPPSE